MSEHLEDEARQAEAQARIGTTLRGKWTLDSLLGMGGMAAVYAATHRNGMRGAVKVLDLTLSRLESMRERFLREGYLANKVDHPGAVRVLDDDVAEDGAAFLVMELLSGQTLEARAYDAGGQLPAAEVLAYTAQVLDALAAAHGLGIIHRDIKPDNLFLTQRGVVKMLDFGLARLLEEERKPTATRSGISMGTPAFMSPEQARGRWDLVDARSDVWGVAATMFTLLTGRMVHQDHQTAAEMIAATFTQQAPSLATLLPDATAELVAVVDGGLRLEREDRWSNVLAMRAAVDVAYHVLTGSGVPSTPSNPPTELAPISSPSPSSRSPVSRPSGEAALSFSPTWSQRPRLHSDVSPTLPPPPATQGRSRWLAATGALLLVGCAIGGTVIVLKRGSTAHAAMPSASEPTFATFAPSTTTTEAPAAAIPSTPNGAVIAQPASPPPATTVTAATHTARPQTRGHTIPARDAGPAAQAESTAPATNLFDRRY